MGLSLLREALDAADGRYIRIFPLEGPPIDGLMIDVGEAACLLARLDAATRPDGWKLVPLAQIDGLRDPGPHADFVERALAARALEPDVPPDLPLDDLSAALSAVARNFPLVQVSWGEGESAEGQLMGANAEQIRLLLMDGDDATWQEGTAVLSTPHLACATFGTARQETLQLVAAGITWPHPA